MIRLLLPGSDKARGAYRMQEAVIASLYIDMLGLAKNSPEAVKLRNYKRPKELKEGYQDFADVLYDVIKLRSYDASEISVAEINKRLDDIVAAHETEGRKAVSDILKQLFIKLDAEQQKWLVRIILKNLRLDLGETSVLNQMHPG